MQGRSSVQTSASVRKVEYWILIVIQNEDFRFLVRQRYLLTLPVTDLVSTWFCSPPPHWTQVTLHTVLLCQYSHLPFRRHHSSCPGSTANPPFSSPSPPVCCPQQRWRVHLHTGPIEKGRLICTILVFRKCYKSVRRSIIYFWDCSWSERLHMLRKALWQFPLFHGHACVQIDRIAQQSQRVPIMTSLSNKWWILVDLESRLTHKHFSLI